MTDEFREHERDWAKAERRAAALRGRDDLRTLAQVRGERWLACQAGERRAFERLFAHPLESAEAKIAFQAAVAAGKMTEKAWLDYHAVLIALGGDAAREEGLRLIRRMPRELPSGVRRL
jgi:hypothetical protein